MIRVPEVKHKKGFENVEEETAAKRPIKGPSKDERGVHSLCGGNTGRLLWVRRAALEARPRRGPTEGAWAGEHSWNGAIGDARDPI